MEFQELIDVLESAGYEPRSYSGRSMYGKECVGVTTDDSAVDVLINCLGVAVEPERIDDICDLFRHYNEDSMGRSSIIYFPRVEWEGDNDDDDEESEDDD